MISQHSPRGTWAFLGTLALVACSAGVEDSGASGTGNNANSGGENSGAGNQGAGPSQGGGGNGQGGGFNPVGGSGGEGGMIVNPCGSECGPTELCDGADKGLDNDCDGEVDEGCSCTAGQISSCFKGDPSYLGSPGCNAGSMSCTEQGFWGPCNGGTHADENCFENQVGCHAINSAPFAPKDLTEGLGNFDDDPNITGETFTVTCPVGVMPCPAPTGSDYTALQSGEYTVTYTKTVNGNDESCTFPLFVGARGLRVELSWNMGSIDLDLHLKQPMSTAPWAIGGSNADCGFANCRAYNFLFGSGPSWFSNTDMPPDPVNWYIDPILENNTCYFAPRGEGDTWQSAGMGCHSPRLDIDNIYCTPSVTDPDDFSFCAPENINVDFPPTGEWFRVGVHQYSNSAGTTAFPNVKIFCDGALAANLGTVGYNTPEAPMSFAPSTSNDFWPVADVLFQDNGCIKECVVVPLYQDAGTKTPYVMSETVAGTTNGPAYPAVP